MSGKFDSQRRILSTSQCSCKECDSVVCFKKRRQSGEFCTCKKCESVVCMKTRPLTAKLNCSCEKCVDSKTCFFYTNKTVDLDEIKSDVLKVQSKGIVETNKLNNLDKIKSGVSEKQKYLKMKYEKESINDNNENTNITVQNHSNMDLKVPHVTNIGDSSQSENIAEKPCSKVSVNKTVSLNIKENPSSTVSENKADIVRKSVEIKLDSTVTVIETNDNSRKIEKSNPKELQKPHSRGSYNKTNNLNKSEIEADRQSTLVNNVALNYSQTGLDSFAAKLSAQVMDVPYNDFVKTVPSHKSENSTKTTNLTKLDIINRIKEAYKACSCKVCECIANIPSPVTGARDDMCKCKPCDCDDCRRVNEGLRKKYPSKKYMDSANYCCCEPCKCIDCKMMAIHPNRTIVVAPVGEETQRPVCQCSPCGCLECGNVYGTIATSLTHEISTGVSRHRNCLCEACLNEACDQDIIDSCTCEQRDRVMRKPVQRDTHDYDIRRAIISNTNTNPSTQGESGKPTKPNTIAMFAAFTNSFPRPGTARDNHDSCNCDHCECIVCKDTEGILPAHSQNFGALKRVYKSSNIFKACKCAPCECEICKTNKLNFIEINERGNNCGCEVCDCIDCVNTKPYVIDRSINNFPSQGVCDCVPCECLDCQKVRHKRTGDLCHQQYLDNIYNEAAHNTKKCDLKVSISNTRYINRILHTDGDKSKSCSGKKSTHSHVSKDSKPDMFIYQTYPNYIENSIRNSGRGEFPDQIDDLCKNAKTECCKCNILSEYIDDNHLKKEMGQMECQVSDTYITAVSSCATTSYVVNESGSITPISRKRTTRSSWQSSCNSSGHDHSDYLIRFPRTPAETCINEVMKSNLDRKLNFNRINVSSKANTENDCMKSTKNFLNVRNENDPYYFEYPIEGNCDYFKAIDYRLCKNIDFPKSCDCDPCACDRCSFTKLRYKKCKCDCIACNCSGACLSENQPICIRKNEGTQTLLKLFQDRGQNSLDSEEFLKLNSHIYSSLPHSLNDEMSRNENSLYSDKYMNITKGYCPYNYICRSQESYIDIDNHVDFLSIPIHIDFESVQNTLREARAFSLELMQILEQYEKANIEFESVSQKLKYSQTLLKSNITPMQHTNDAYIEVSHVEKENNMKNEEQSNVYENQERNQCLTQNVVLKKEQLENSPLHKSERNNIADESKLSDNQCKEIYAPRLSLAPIIDSQSLLESCSSKQSIKIHDTDTLCLNIFDQVSKQLIKERQEVKLRNKYKTYRKLIKRAMWTARRYNSSNKPNVVTSGTTTSENESTQIVEDKQKITVEMKYLEHRVHIEEDITKGNELNEDMNKLSVVFNSTTVNTPESLKKLEEQTIKNDLKKKNSNSVYVNNEKSKEVQERNQIQERRNFAISKNLRLDIKTINETQGFTTKLPVLETNVNGTVESLSTQAEAIEDIQVLKPCYGNDALTHMRVRVKNQIPKLNDLVGVENKLRNEEISINATKKQDLELKDTLDLTTSQTNSKLKDIGNKEASCIQAAHSTTCAKSSCDAMKISFNGVRRVSDHTILVKWNPPRSTKDIQGYELLVDGRAVEKVLSPTRCMAVVTCLPQTETVLLTIRILTTTGPSDHYPSTTIVYRPRAK